MYQIGDRVEAVTADHFNGAFGEVVEVLAEYSDARVLLDDESVPLWFDFSELRKVDA
jgi:hypothetical protein